MVLFVLYAVALSQKPEPLPIPKSYVCYRANGPISIDGRLDDLAWKTAPWTDDFVDIVGSSKPSPRFRTRAKMLWDENNLYIGADLEEPQMWATLTKHDSVIFHDNDFEVFIDPDNDGCFYSELELNALNTTWDLLLPRSYRGGGPAIDGFELAGLQTGVHVDGKLNDVRAVSRGWTTEIAIPWKAFKDMGRTSLPPHDRDQWRINFSRVEWHVDEIQDQFVKRPGLPEDNWVWSPQGVVDMHRPEQWGFLQFSTQTEGAVHVDPSPGFAERRVLISAWERQQSYRRDHGRWARSVEELGMELPGMEIYAGRDQFEVTYQGFALDQTLRFWKR
jgi:hypothetical protein